MTTDDTIIPDSNQPDIPVKKVKRKYVLHTLKKKPQTFHRQVRKGIRGRIPTNYPFEKARELVQYENLDSCIQYDKWWLENRPVKLPKRPDRAYKKVWKGWNDFLGNKNSFPTAKKKFRKFVDARDYVRSLKLNNRQEYRDLINSGKLPPDIPKRPDYFYGCSSTYAENDNTGHVWYSWRDWLGSTSFTDQLESIRKQLNVLVVCQNPQHPKNVFTFVTLTGFQEDIQYTIKNSGFIIVKVYIINEYDWGGDLSKAFPLFNQIRGCYTIPNINQVIYHFDMQMEKF